MSAALHPEAVQRFNELGNRLFGRVKGAQPERQRYVTFKPEVYTGFTLQKEHLAGPITVSKVVVDGRGKTVGWLFPHQGDDIGLIGDAYQELLILAGRICAQPDLRETTSEKFITDTVLDWIRGKHAGLVSESLSDYILRQTDRRVKEREIWLPIYRLYLQSPLTLGRVRFQTVTKEMLDEREAMLVRAKPDATSFVKQHMDQERKKYQGNAAACLTLRAEPLKATQVAFDEASRALALIRFLSPTNWIPDKRSFCDFVGQENTRVRHQLEIANGAIGAVHSSEIDEGESGWALADAWIAQFPGIISNLNKVLSKNSEFACSLLDALQLYSRNSLTADPTDKLVFILVALESLLLKDRNEPIQKNIGERMAFLIGQDVDARKAIVANTGKVYEERSSFVHHGESVNNVEVLAKFMLDAWTCFYTLIQEVDKIATKLQLIQALEDRKMQ